jgi:hypothetical protein
MKQVKEISSLVFMREVLLSPRAIWGALLAGVVIACLLYLNLTDRTWTIILTMLFIWALNAPLALVIELIAWFRQQ